MWFGWSAVVYFLASMSGLVVMFISPLLLMFGFPDAPPKVSG